MRSVITSGDVSELRRLYGELPNAAAEVREALKTGGGSLTGAALQHFIEVDARFFAIIERIKAVLA